MTTNKRAQLRGFVHERLALLHLYIDAINGGELAETLVEVLGNDQRLRHARAMVTAVTRNDPALYERGRCLNENPS